jgi:uncharacterized protein YbjT (DUF2867 family)
MSKSHPPERHRSARARLVLTGTIRRTSLKPIVTITGATGHVGRALTAQLVSNGTQVRAVARSADKLAALAAQGAETCPGTLDDTTFLTGAYRGSAAVFVILPGSPPDAPDYLADQARLTANLARAIAASGVERVVALSGQGAGLRYGVLAAFTGLEEALRSIPGLSVVALRSCYQMKNLLGSIPLIRRAGINAGPLRADLPSPMIASCDIAAVAAEYLLAPSFRGYQVRDLLGPRAYTQREATAILGAAIGRPGLAYREVPYEEYRTNLLGMGFSASGAEALVQLFRAVNEGPANTYPPRDTTNTTPTTLEEFVRDTFVPAYQVS